jgi:hypothetical protein
MLLARGRHATPGRSAGLGKFLFGRSLDLVHVWRRLLGSRLSCARGSCYWPVRLTSANADCRRFGSLVLNGGTEAISRSECLVERPVDRTSDRARIFNTASDRVLIRVVV